MYIKVLGNEHKLVLFYVWFWINMVFFLIVFNLLILHNVHLEISAAVNKENTLERLKIIKVNMVSGENSINTYWNVLIKVRKWKILVIYIDIKINRHFTFIPTNDRAATDIENCPVFENVCAIVVAAFKVPLIHPVVVPSPKSIR